MPTGMENTASTANYRTIPRMNVSKEFMKRNRAETDKAGPRVYLTENSDSQNQGQQLGFH
jgi:hypothetical protein